MPRIPTILLREAYKENPLLLNLLKECRSLEHARNELRWLRENPITKSRNRRIPSKVCADFGTETWQQELKRMCVDRGKGKPLQYILGDQPFGDLEILCEKGVLIPRGETESYTAHARDLILKWYHTKRSKEDSSLRILDLCSGSGCISLLLHSLLAAEIQDLTIVGVDVNPQAIKLSQRNKEHNIRRGLLSSRAENEVSFLLADILGLANPGTPSLAKALESCFGSSTARGSWDVLISNPPYISPSNFVNGTTSRSVRKYEPIEALVPPPVVDPSIWQNLGFKHVAREDIFYARLLSLVYQFDVKVAVFECGDLEQAQLVVAMAHELSKTVGDRGKMAVYIWDDCYTVDDKDGGARAVILERTI